MRLNRGALALGALALIATSCAHNPPSTGRRKPGLREAVGIGLKEKDGVCGIAEWPDQLILNKSKQAVWDVARDRSSACKGFVVGIGSLVHRASGVANDSPFAKIESNADNTRIIATLKGSGRRGLWTYEIVDKEGKPLKDPEIDLIDY
jgi:hypothetical protein